MGGRDGRVGCVGIPVGGDREMRGGTFGVVRVRW